MVALRDFDLPKSELKDISIIILLLSFLFSLTILKFSDNISFISTFIQVIIFLTILMFSRLFFMKYIALKQGFKINLYQTKFASYGIRKYENIKSFQKYHFKPEKTKIPVFSKIPMTIITFLLYVISFGFFIYSPIWRYKTTKVDHLFLGTKQRWEQELGFMQNTSISNFRQMKVLFSGYLFYFIFALFLKFILPQEEFLSWPIFILFYLAFFSLIPIFGTEGYDLFVRNRFAHISSITMLFLAMLSLLIFSSFEYVLISSIFSIIIVISIIFYKKFF